MSAVFISYRRDDSSGHTGRIYDHLRDQFGKDYVFRDIDAIEPGTDFVEAVEKGIKGCSTLIVIIGDQWLTAMDEHGHRLDDPNDFVRIEVASAIRKKLRIIPVLVKGATMPSAADLPADIAALARRHALEISDSRWDYDIGRLIATLSAVQSAEEDRKAAVDTADALPPPRHKSGNSVLTITAVVGVLLAAVFLWQYFIATKPPQEVVKPPAVMGVGDSGAKENGSGGSVVEIVRPKEIHTQQQSVQQIKPAEVIREIESKPKVSNSQIQLQQQLDKMLAGANADFSSQRFTSPAGNNAFEKYQQVLRLSPDNSDAKSGLRKIGVKYLSLARSALRKGKFKAANHYVDLAQKADPNTPGIVKARNKVRLEQEKERSRRAVMAKPKTVTPDQEWPSAEPAPIPKPELKPVVPVIQNTVEKATAPKAVFNEAEARSCLDHCKSQNNACVEKSRLQTEACHASIETQCNKVHEACEDDPRLSTIWGEMGAASECLGVWHQCKDDKAGQCEQLQDESAADCDSSYSACQQSCR